MLPSRRASNCLIYSPEWLCFFVGLRNGFMFLLDSFNRIGFIALRAQAWILLLAAPNCSWMLMATPGCTWLLQAAPSCSRLLLVAPGCSGLVLVLASPGWVLLAPFWWPANSSHITIQNNTTKTKKTPNVRWCRFLSFYNTKNNHH